MIAASPQLLVFLLVLAGMIFFFLSEKLPVDVTALLGLLIFTLLGYLSPAEAFAGLSSPAVTTMLCMFILSTGLRESGLADALGNRIIKIAGKGEAANVLAVTLLAALVSSIMNNLAAAALLLPAVISVARKTSIPASRLLIPLSFGTILGGTITLIGTTTNMVAATLLSNYGLRPFSFLEFAPFGLTFAALGSLYIAFAGRHLLPRNPSPEKPMGSAELAEFYRIYERIFALRIAPDSDLAGQTLESAQLGTTLGVQVIAIERGGRRLLAPAARDRLEGGDVLVVGGRLDDLENLKRVRPRSGSEPGALSLPDQAETSKAQVGLSSLSNLEIIADYVAAELESSSVGIGEAVLSPRSKLLGSTLHDLNFRDKYGLQVIAIWRDGRPWRSRLSGMALKFGDALLLQGARDKLVQLARDPDFVVLSETLSTPTRPGKSPFVLFSLLLMILLPAFGIQPIETASLLSALLVVLSGAVTMEEAYRDIEWRIVVVLAALLPVGLAFERSGAAAILAGAITEVAGDFGVLPVLLLLCLISSLLSQALDAALAVVLLGPVCLKVAAHLGMGPHPLIMAVALAASIAFMTPFSSRTNMLVMGAGGYKASDYFVIGTVLSVIMLALLVLMIPLIYRF